MTRDWSLIRLALLDAAGERDASQQTQKDALVSCLAMLHAAGFVDAESWTSDGTKRSKVLYVINWHGHELLDTIRDPETFKRITDVLDQAKLGHAWHLIRHVAQQMAVS